MRSVLKNFGFRPVGKHINYYYNFFIGFAIYSLLSLAGSPPCFTPAASIWQTQYRNSYVKLMCLPTSELSEHGHSYVIEIQRSINSKDSKNPWQSHCFRSMRGF